MSEQAKEAPAKKKGKLPMIVILAVVLGGGGFFGMKMRGGGEKKEPEIKLGPVVEIKDEFLTNMAERSSYVRTKISLQFKDGFDVAKISADLAPIQDAINMKLQATSVKSVSTPEGLRKLKLEMAASINKLLEETEAKHDEEKDKDKKGKKKKKKKKEEDEEYEEPEIPEGWDSAEGPVLKILFVSFATQ